MTLQLDDIAKRVGAEMHIHPTSVTLAETGFNVLLGETGAGKTTLIKIMAGLDKPTAGRVLLNGRDVTDVSTRRRNVSLVHQFFVNYPNMTVYENIASPLRVGGVAGPEIKRRVGEAAELLRLTPYLDRAPAELSGGQQQRTALARAIVKDSDLVLLDEPLANLDYKLREELRDQLPQLFAGRGATVVYATSEPGEALLLGGHVACMEKGRITQFGPTAETYRAPATLDTARVFSDPPINIAEVRKEAGEIVLDDAVRWPAAGAVAAAPDGPLTLGVRPHWISPDPLPGAEATVRGRVLITELSGSESVAHFDMGGRTWVSQSDGVHPFRIGETQDFHIDVRGCLYFGADDALIAA